MGVIDPATIGCDQCGRETAFIAGPPAGWALTDHTLHDGRHLETWACSPQCQSFLAHEVARHRLDARAHLVGTQGDGCRACTYAIRDREEAIDDREAAIAESRRIKIYTPDTGPFDEFSGLETLASGPRSDYGDPPTG